MIDKYSVGKATCNLESFNEKGFGRNSSLKWVTNLHVPEEHRKQGLAKALLKQLGKDADEAQISLILECRGYEDGIDENALDRLYRQFGFVEVQSDPKLMLRIPVPPALFESLKQKPASKIITNLYS
ncbi:MAG: GNAT family N-acetyltransferase [Pseudomonadota bacterium]